MRASRIRHTLAACMFTSLYASYCAGYAVSPAKPVMVSPAQPVLVDGKSITSMGATALVSCPYPIREPKTEKLCFLWVDKTTQHIYMAVSLLPSIHQSLSFHSARQVGSSKSSAGLSGVMKNNELYIAFNDSENDNNVVIQKTYFVKTPENENSFDVKSQQAHVINESNERVRSTLSPTLAYNSGNKKIFYLSTNYGPRFVFTYHLEPYNKMQETYIAKLMQEPVSSDSTAAIFNGSGMSLFIFTPRDLHIESNQIRDLDFYVYLPAGTVDTGLKKPTAMTISKKSIFMFGHTFYLPLVIATYDDNKLHVIIPKLDLKEEKIDWKENDTSVNTPLVKELSSYQQSDSQIWVLGLDDKGTVLASGVSVR